MVKGKESLQPDQALILHVLMLVVIIGGGLYTYQSINDDLLNWMAERTVADSGISDALIGSILTQVEKLPPQIKIFLLLSAIRGIAYGKVIYIPLFGVCAGLLEAKIRLNTDVGITPSAVSYHRTGKAAVFAVVYLPLGYICIPLEVFLSGVSITAYRYIYAIASAVVCYQLFYTRTINRPPII